MIDLLHDCFFEGVNRFLAKPGNDSRRRSTMPVGSRPQKHLEFGDRLFSCWVKQVNFVGHEREPQVVAQRYVAIWLNPRLQ